jgi:hypothetical protein
MPHVGKSENLFRLKEVSWQNLDMAKTRKNAAAVALGRLGGLKGGKARAQKLTAERRREIAVRAVKARWTKKKR